MKAARMQNSSALMLKQEFLKKWKKGLQIYTNFKNEMTISERKKSIKFSADIAIASTRNASTNWSRALIADAVSKNTDKTSKIVIEKILGRKIIENNNSKALMMIACSEKIMRRSRLARYRKKARRPCVGRTSVKASCIAKQLVKKRTRVLKRLVPGGEQMDEICLIKETLDYIASLQVQVDVMRNLAAVAERLDPPERSMCDY